VPRRINALPSCECAARSSGIFNSIAHQVLLVIIFGVMRSRSLRAREAMMATLKIVPANSAKRRRLENERQEMRQPHVKFNTSGSQITPGFSLLDG
jgi:hypothetical protein